ncbi:MAG: biotin transporter BioY [Lachnospiraceae bacterium]|nr:biotin transporter BioY [Lachnospiraceae bacterium]
MTKTKSMDVRQMALVGMMSAVLCILGPLSLPIGLVPISLASLGVYFIAYVLGSRRAVISCLVYLILGLVGLPVFSSFSGGAGKLFGPTGGYLIGYLFTAAICGWFVERFPGKRVLHALGMVLGTAVLYLIGTVWLAVQANLSASAALATGVTPFLIGDCVKIVAALAAGPVVRKRLAAAGLTESLQ